MSGPRNHIYDALRSRIRKFDPNEIKQLLPNVEKILNHLLSAEGDESA